MRQKLAAGNWKMNGLAENLREITTLMSELGKDLDTEVLICPPATLLHRAVQSAQESQVQIGAQDCHAESNGAYTGDISARMVAEAGGSHVIVGHSERRTLHGETDTAVRAKAEAALAAGLHAIICIGETEAERDAGTTLERLATQLAGSCPETATPQTVTIAYEPVWAIGTGRTPSQAQIIEVHDSLRARLAQRFGSAGAEMRLLYGGSVKASNAATIFAAQNVDGALVGGASLKAQDFIPIVNALRAA